MYLKKILDELYLEKGKIQAIIPGLWIGEKVDEKIKMDYASFLIGGISNILTTKHIDSIDNNKNWTSRAIVYNIFVRLFTAYDHNQDGIIGSDLKDITINRDGLRETGTFLKTIALLPYLKSLGINTIHLLPVTEIGSSGRKGNLGSPYAIKNPFKLDPNLGDPIIDIPINDQYGALVEAAHLLGIKVIQEFIFRTAAIDSDWSLNHPEWFYWVKEEKKYHPPTFTARQLKQILKIPKDKGKYIPPNKTYRNLFAIPTKHISKKNITIASAFADWPPNDVQPPWTDVTYLRLFEYDYEKENNFNYIAYNTVRYYDPELAKKEHINYALWDKIADIIPHYQNNFNINGAMIDMGHALPNLLKSEIINKARENDPLFAFWDENFRNTKETKQEGYDAVIGDAWYKIAKRNGFRKIIASALDKHPLPYFGTAETHNSPRFGVHQIAKKKSAWLLFNMIPHAIPFLHNGFEFDEVLPVNTGLNFTKKEIDNLAGKPLPLFYKNSLGWNSKANIIDFIKTIAALRQKHLWIFEGKNISILETTNRRVLGIMKHYRKKSAMILFNTNFYRNEFFSIPRYSGKTIDLISKQHLDFSGTIQINKGGFLITILQ